MNSRMPQGPVERFESQLNAEQTQTHTDFKDRANELIRRMNDRSANLRSRFEIAFDAKADAITNQVKQMQESIKTDSKEAEALKLNRLKIQHELALQSLHRRATLLIQVATPGEKRADAQVSTASEMQQLEKTLKMFNNTSVDQFLAKAGVDASYLKIENDNYGQSAILEKLRGSQPLTEAEVQALVNQTELSIDFGKGRKLNPRAKAEVRGMLTLLSNEQRKTIFTKVMENAAKQESPEHAMQRVMHIVLNFAEMNLLSIADAKAIIPPALGGGNGKPSAHEFLDSDHFKSQRAAYLKLGRQIEDHIASGEQFGHRNTVKSLLSIRGLTGAFLQTAGGVTIAANLAMNPFSPINPGTMIGGAALMTGREISNPGATRGLYEKLTRDPDELVTEKQERVLNTMRSDIQNKSLYARVYEVNAFPIFLAFKAMKEEKNRTYTFSSSSETAMAAFQKKLKEQNFDMEAYAKTHPEVNADALKRQLFDWAKEFDKVDEGLGIRDCAAQIKFIQDSLKDNS